MNIKNMEHIKKMLCEELEEITAKGDISRSDLEDVHKLTDTIKNIDKIIMLEEDGYSGDGEWVAKGSYGNESYGTGSYDNGYGSRRSGARGRHYVRGHYSYGEDMDELTDKMERLMQDGSMTGEEKTILRRAMDVIRK